MSHEKEHKSRWGFSRRRHSSRSSGDGDDGSSSIDTMRTPPPAGAAGVASMPMSIVSSESESSSSFAAACMPPTLDRQTTERIDLKPAARVLPATSKNNNNNTNTSTLSQGRQDLGTGPPLLPTREVTFGDTDSSIPPTLDRLNVKPAARVLSNRNIKPASTLPRREAGPGHGVLPTREASLGGTDSSSMDTTLQSVPSEWICKSPNVDIAAGTTSRIRYQASGQEAVVVVANAPIPTDLLQRVAMKRRRCLPSKRGSTLETSPLSNLSSRNLLAEHSSRTSSMYPSLGGSSQSSPSSSFHRNSDSESGSQQPPVAQVFYFEITLEAVPANATVRVGLLTAAEGPGANHNAMPGQVNNLIGLDLPSGQVWVSGRAVSKGNGPASSLEPGHVIGCGMEVLGMRRIFFTWNGNLLIPPTNYNGLNIPDNFALPAVGLMSSGSSRGGVVEVVANLGTRQNFSWSGSDSLVPIPLEELYRHNASPQSSKFMTPPRPTVGSLSFASPATAGRQDLSFGGDSKAVSLKKAASPAPLYGRRSDRRSNLEDDLPNVEGVPVQTVVTPLYGRRNDRRSNLEDDLPNVDGVPVSAPVYGRKSLRGSLEDDLPDVDGVPMHRPPDFNATGSPPVGSRLSPSVPSPHGQISFAQSSSTIMSALTTSTIGAGAHLPSRPSAGSSVSFPAASLTTPTVPASPRSLSVASNNVSRTEEDIMNAAIKRSVETTNVEKRVLIPQDEIEDHKSCARELRTCCDNDDVGESTIRNLLELCKTIQGTVMKHLEEAMTYDPSTVDLEELFALNDYVLEAIRTAEKTLEGKERIIGEQKSSSFIQESNLVGQGETRPAESKIDEMARNKDVLNLICMLRGQGDQRLEAALALLRFAEDAEQKGDGESLRLRNEIRSSGGMHSLLSLFRSQDTTRELKVVAALAVAYLLPSFVASGSMPSTELCLRIVECLRFLFMSKPVSPMGKEISRREMFNASAMGLTTFWINALYPMLHKDSSESLDHFDLRRKVSSSSFCGRGRQIQMFTGGETFDQGQHKLELRELLEMTVSLVVNMAKLTEHEFLDSEPPLLQPSQSKMNLRYTLVEQLCAVDVARPIAVREGLLKVLVGWMKSGDREKVGPATTALQDLTSTKDQYMAGWIHSEIVNEGALSEIVKLSVSESLGHDVRLRVAQILSSLCVAPHLRAAVVEAQCINYLIPLLYDHTDPSSQKVALAAGSALLQLAAGAMSRASVYDDSVSADKRDSVINDILQGGAMGPFVSMAKLNDRNKLRSMAIEALRVLSEDSNPSRCTRQQLCEEGAVEALGLVLKDDTNDVIDILNPSRDADTLTELKRSTSLTVDDLVKELHQALCGLANILSSVELSPVSHQRMYSCHEGQTLATRQTVESGGLQILLCIASLPFASHAPSTDKSPIGRNDLLVEACRCLVSLAPLLLLGSAAVERYMPWSSELLETFAQILKQSLLQSDSDEVGISDALRGDALRGLSALAKSEPLKIRIVDKSLPHVLQIRSARGDNNNVSSAAGQVCLSLGFAEEEIAVQVAGSDPNLLVDWFCMQRSLLIQAMARDELKMDLARTWRSIFEDAKIKGVFPPPTAFQEDSGFSAGSFEDFFTNLASDDESAEQREQLLDEYEKLYRPLETTTSDTCFPHQREDDEAGLLSTHVYPLNDTNVEKDWILAHRQVLYAKGDEPSDSHRVRKLFDCCMPSRLLQNEILPIHDLRPESSFNFRALVMPQRRYFSFRREGQLVSQLCDKQAALLASNDVHWTLGFTNSSFAGEFSETLVQALYRCPEIRGLSFARNEDWAAARADTDTNEIEDGSGLLANLAASLPPWVSYVTYDNVLNERAVKALVAILETLGKLSAGQMEQLETSSEQKQGAFRLFGIRNSPHIGIDAWLSLFDLLGNKAPAHLRPSYMPLASLRALDLSGNNLGDEACACVLEIIHEKGAGCCVERLDLGGNGIGQGKHVTKVLKSYIELHRYNQNAGVKMKKRSWRAPLHTLNLSCNNLGDGGLALEMIALLKNNTLALKSLDLSSNSLEDRGYQFTEVLCWSLMKNTCLCHLDISGNHFSHSCMDDVLQRLNNAESETGISFLLLADNDPELTDIQKQELEVFLKRSRRVALERFVGDRERIKKGENFDDPVLFERNPSLSDVEFPPRPSTAVPNVSLSEAGPSVALRSLPTIERPSEKGNNMITVLFSAPLVFHDEERKLRPFAKLDFDMERELIWQCLKEASRDIELSFDNATHHRLLAAITKRCSCLHYSGHGHPAYLPLENGKGGPHWLQVNVLQDLIAQGGGAPFKFVFVSACYSGLAGETFASAGVPHVVCCQQESELKDAAALAFTRQFYLALTIGHTVKDSFDQGCKAVRALPGLRNAEDEMKKFVLLPHEGNHDVPVFSASPLREWPITDLGSSRGLHQSKSRRKRLARHRWLYFGGAKSSELSVRNMMQEDPSPTPPQFFLGREVDMYHVLCAVLTKRLVSIVGDAGVGRSSLACALCHYINERRSTILEIEQIFWVKTKQSRGGDRCRQLIQSLFDKLVEADQVRSRPSITGMEGLFQAVCNALKNNKALLVFDRTELLDGDDEVQDFPLFLSTLFRETRNVRVLLTGQRPLGIASIGGVTEQSYRLGPLNFANTTRLFANLCPHLHTPSERQDFFVRLVTDGEQADIHPNDANASERTQSFFDMLGNGMPADVENAAYSFSQANLLSILTDDVVGTQMKASER